MEKAYGYCRTSSRSQIGNYGADRQEETILMYAKKAGYEIEKFYFDEAVSGTLDENHRPAFQQMVADILANGVNTIICEGLDRLSRTLQIQESHLIYLASKDIVLISARTEENVTEAVKSDPLRKALISIQGVFFELEKNLLTKKLQNGREKCKAEKGKCEGRKSYEEALGSGYDALVKEVKRLRRKPYKGSKIRSYTEIAGILNQNGYKAASGKDLTGQIIQNMLR